MDTLTYNDEKTDTDVSRENIMKIFEPILSTNQMGGRPTIPLPLRKTNKQLPPIQRINDVPYKEESEIEEPEIPKRAPKKDVKVPNYLKIFTEWDNVSEPSQELYNYALFLTHYLVTLPELKIKLYILISEWLVINEYYRYVGEPLSDEFEKFMPPVRKSFIYPSKSESINVIVIFMTKSIVDITKEYTYLDFIYILSMDRMMTEEANKLFKDAFLNYIINNSDYYTDLKFIPHVSRTIIDIILGGKCGFYPDPLPKKTYDFLTELAGKDDYPTLLGLNNVCDCIKAFNEIKKYDVLNECRDQLDQIQTVYFTGGDSNMLRVIESLANELEQLIHYSDNLTEMKTYDDAKVICTKPYVCKTAEQTLLMLHYKINNYTRMCKDHIRQITTALQKQISAGEDMNSVKVYLSNSFPWIQR